MKQKKSSWNKGLKNPTAFFNGRNYEELYGIEKANQLKEQKRLIMLKNTRGFKKGQGLGDANIAKRPEIGAKISLKMRGSNNHQYIDGRSKKNVYTNSKWINLREEVFKRDNCECQKCLSPHWKKRIVGHHIISWQDSPELRLDKGNIITLCVPCHKEVHNFRQDYHKWQFKVFSNIYNGGKFDLFNKK
jgi:hypothetical protein